MRGYDGSFPASFMIAFRCRIIAARSSLLSFGTIRNILKDMGVNFQTLVKKSTNCVLVGDKRRPSKYTRLKIETYRQEGQKISLMKISVLDTPTISTTITEIPTNITQKNIVQNKKLQKIIRVLWCILGFIFLIILLATTT